MEQYEGQDALRQHAGPCLLDRGVSVCCGSIGKPAGGTDAGESATNLGGGDLRASARVDGTRCSASVEPNGRRRACQ